MSMLNAIRVEGTTRSNPSFLVENRRTLWISPFRQCIFVDGIPIDNFVRSQDEFFWVLRSRSHVFFVTRSFLGSFGFEGSKFLLVRRSGRKMRRSGSDCCGFLDFGGELLEPL